MVVFGVKRRAIGTPACGPQRGLALVDAVYLMSVHVCPAARRVRIAAAPLHLHQRTSPLPAVARATRAASFARRHGLHQTCTRKLVRAIGRCVGSSCTSGRTSAISGPTPPPASTPGGPLAPQDDAGLHRAQHHRGGICLPDLLQRDGPRRVLLLDRLPFGYVVAGQQHVLVVGTPTDEAAGPEQLEPTPYSTTESSAQAIEQTDRSVDPVGRT